MMFRLQKLIFNMTLISFVIILYNCSSVNTKTYDFQVTYAKTKGRLKTKPHYIIRLKGDSVSYNGIANMSIIGERNFKISKSELKQIRKAFEESDFSSFDQLYQGNVRDLPITNITYNDYEVRFQSKQAPEKLKELALLMEELLHHLSL